MYVRTRVEGRRHARRRGENVDALETFGSVHLREQLVDDSICDTR